MAWRTDVVRECLDCRYHFGSGHGGYSYEPIQLEQLQAEYSDMTCTRGRGNPPVLVGAPVTCTRHYLVAPRNMSHEQRWSAMPIQGGRLTTEVCGTWQGQRLWRRRVSLPLASPAVGVPGTASLAFGEAESRPRCLRPLLSTCCRRIGVASFASSQ